MALIKSLKNYQSSKVSSLQQLLSLMETQGSLKEGNLPNGVQMP